MRCGDGYAPLPGSGSTEMVKFYVWHIPRIPPASGLASGLSHANGKLIVAKKVCVPGALRGPVAEARGARARQGLGPRMHGTMPQCGNLLKQTVHTIRTLTLFLLLLWHPLSDVWWLPTNRHR